MKSAREHAEALANAFGWSPSHRLWQALVEAAEPMFKVHGRDQLALCVEAVLTATRAGSSFGFSERVKSFVENAPAPGETR